MAEDWLYGKSNNPASLAATAFPTKASADRAERTKQLAAFQTKVAFIAEGGNNPPEAIQKFCATIKEGTHALEVHHTGLVLCKNKPGWVIEVREAMSGIGFGEGSPCADDGVQRLLQALVPIEVSVVDTVAALEGKGAANFFVGKVERLDAIGGDRGVDERGVFGQEGPDRIEIARFGRCAMMTRS